jgi:hypothetical protein
MTAATGDALSQVLLEWQQEAFFGEPRLIEFACHSLVRDAVRNWSFVPAFAAWLL